MRSIPVLTRCSRHLFLALLLGACQSSGSPSTDAPAYSEPGTKLQLSLSTADQAELDQLDSELDKLAGLTTKALLDKHPVQFNASLGYDPSQAQNLDLIQASALKLNPEELEKLRAQGFVITPRNQFPNMLYGYKTIYAADLPVYVSLDSILDAVHISYDAILKLLESAQLSADLRTLLEDARSHLNDASLDPKAAHDLDVYFGVALSLLEPTPQAPVFADNATLVSQLVAKATAAAGFQEISLFGVTRTMDFSQFKPRGHYTETPELTQYFRALMWMGRTDFRLIDTNSDGSTVFRRRQLEATLALASVVQGPGRAAYDRIDQAVTAFVGEHDYMQLAEVELLLADLGGQAAVSARSDAEIARLIVDKGYGAQRIASQVIYRDTASAKPLPLTRSFALLGQRYVVDSEVFSNVVFDRVPAKGPKGSRGLPNPLDAAYAAFGNSAALPLLKDELDGYAYAPQLERMHALVEAHGEDYWKGNLYNLWLATLRAVSPPEGAQTPAAQNKPAVTGSEAWSRRMLNTQLGSWAELRHDTLLYAKQSYSAGNSCEFPDGFIDPYPEAFARLEAFALKGREVAALFSGPQVESVRLYFENLAQISALLRGMAEQQQTGVPFGPEQLSFLNDAVRTQIVGCGTVSFQGWYTRLLFSMSNDDMDPTVADVHTDVGDNRPPRVLYVATGLPRLMVVTRESCSGPRAYAGLAFAYHEIVKELPRLADEDWAPLAPKAEDVAFMKPILP